MNITVTREAITRSKFEILIIISISITASGVLNKAIADEREVRQEPSIYPC